MYGFTDTIGTPGAGTLPAEAMSVNGVYIESAVSGYRTLTVSGREILAPELFTNDAAKTNGIVYQGRRYPAREITITYQLVCSTSAAFRTAYNKLNEILSQEQAQLIFADESDKYFVGTLSGMTAVEAGRNAVTGEFTMTCTDPFKYSVTEYSATLQNGAANITYGGTMPSYPVLVAEFYQSDEDDNNDGDCGYVAFANDREKIIQLGDPEETDKGEFPELKSQTLINQTFNKAPGNAWTHGDGVCSSNAFDQTLIAPQVITYDGYKYLMATQASNNTPPIANGGTLVRAIPADRNGDVGAKNFKVTFSVMFSAFNDYCQGNLQVILSDANNKVVCGAAIYKASNGTKGTIRLYVNSKTVKNFTGVDMTMYNTLFGYPKTSTSKIKRTCTITKDGGTVSFDIAGKTFKITDNAIKNTVVTKLTLGVFHYAGKGFLTAKGFFSCKFVKNNCETWLDVPNKFGTNDVVTADCRTGDIFVMNADDPDGTTGNKRPYLGALGNDWEDFYLVPGANAITGMYSDWVDEEHAPTFKVRWREVYL